MIHQNIINFNKEKQTIEWLKAVDMTKEVDSIFRKASGVLVKSMKSRIPIRDSGILLSRYRSRMHPAGTLKQSIKFKKSRKYKQAYFIGSMSSPGMDTYYSRIYISGSKGLIIGTKGGKKSALINGEWVRKNKLIGGFKPHPYLDEALLGTEIGTIATIDKGLFELVKRKLQ